MNTSDLEKLGLTKNESKVYLALLELGSINADPIIKKTGLHRNIVYDNLDKLAKKGLAGFVVKNNRKYFEASQPGQILEWIRQKKAEAIDNEKLAESIMPDIESLRKLSKEKKEAIVLSGVKSVMALVIDMPEEGNFDMFATGYGMRTLFPVQYKRFNDNIAKYKRKVRAIISENLRHEDQGSSINRFLPEYHMLPVNTSILKDRVNIIIFEKDPIAIQIRSREVADSYRTYFNFMWSIAKK
ncbi:hypothetical protein COV19_04520 [Candidatus Woesearchaeota archaeon CG10_big_fil_rev_8_21_14_0_10_44_13]|nr:MAG: hypothetical protein COV19_04520 [Candidatus Woesearchaeota archaeon CG10_big_fil_rev_8_21_14_0_10_44_13]